tara:strand:- start:19959 stop:21776 length:1818 start_codon:yes stop_codon:yes gene_type:complete
MAIDSNLKVNALDFTGIKNNLKTYLQSQDEFRDYNFEASGISTLLDILSYNTYYNAFYLNMSLQEAFITTAQKRNSVVKAASALNYTPRSTTSASISGTVALTVSGSPATVTIPAYTEFTGSIEGIAYTFLNTSAVVVSESSGVYNSAITLKEGAFVTNRYTVNVLNTDQRFLIPNLLVDTSTLTVQVINSSTDSTTRTFTSAENVVTVDGTSQVYFLREVEDGQFEVKFGDDVIGKKLDNGNIVLFSYLISSGTNGNDVTALTYSGSISGVTGATFTKTAPSSGGASRQSISSIKFSAPKSYESQNRVVTIEDYKGLLLSQPNISGVSVWGGEDNDPPSYGKVYISVIPTTGTVLTATEKNNLINSVIKPKRVLTVSTEIVDPDYIYLQIVASVKYDATLTTKTSGDIQALATTTIKNYNTTDINQFLEYFRYSKLSRLIDLSDESILNNSLSTTMRKEVAVQLGTPAKYDIKFSNAIDDTTDGRISSHAFSTGNQVASNSFSTGGFSNCFLDDNNGIIRIYRLDGVDKVSVNLNAGTINYSTGLITLTDFNPTAFADGGSTLKITAIPENQDILPLRNQVVAIQDADITVNAVNDNTISLVNR